MLSIFIRTIIIYILLYVSLKIMGKREIGELEVNELVTTLLISEIASLPISDANIPILHAVVPIIFIASLEVLVSVIKNKFKKLKPFVEGEPTYLIYKGEFRQKVLSDNRLSINEILTEMRLQGVNDISEIYYAIIEQNGKLSVCKRCDKDTATHTVIVDGGICKSNLSGLGYSIEWLSCELSKRKLSVRDVFLMTVRDNGVINIIERDKK